MIPLLDTHLHLIYREKFKYSWTNEIKELATSNFTLDNHKKITEDLGVAGALFMETGVDDSYYKDETRFVNSIKMNPQSSIKGIIASIRPEYEEGFEEWLSETIELGVVGYRRILHVMPNELSEIDIFRKNINMIGKANKIFDVCFLAYQLKIALELVKTCENTRMVLNHCGVPNIAGNELEPWRKDITALAKMPNLSCKLSGIMAYCSPGTSSLENIEPYVDHILNCFGPNRIVWGSDWPVVNLGKGLNEWIKVTRNILSKLSVDEANLIANQTAQDIYKVKI